ncbi:cwf18 pre-mRNA splicing factor-domain-containing protein [Collybia nuda]|uniref:Cwf18 pre-mRNA splicing factor-domain-containing protein n=1 Tax=Collybia nuda TaxID=64659 RepID=A0A9P5YK37_9AGAR|nr:cwf18 pre-mRNA splicing factor-domain-containing protein [Collybia nuda]
MSLAEASEARKARLLALRKRKAGEDVADAPLLKGRNFDPVSRTLRKRNQGDDVEMEDTVEKNVEGMAEGIIAEDEQRRAQELDVFNIAPKRPNWDLKREMEKKLAKLERRTQESIHTLIRQRLSAQKGEADDIMGAMNAQERQNASEALSDEED